MILLSDSATCTICPIILVKSLKSCTWHNQGKTWPTPSTFSACNWENTLLKLWLIHFYIMTWITGSFQVQVELWDEWFHIIGIITKSLRFHMQERKHTIVSTVKVKRWMFKVLLIMHLLHNQLSIAWILQRKLLIMQTCTVSKCFILTLIIPETKTFISKW